MTGAESLQLQQLAVPHQTMTPTTSWSVLTVACSSYHSFWLSFNSASFTPSLFLIFHAFVFQPSRMNLHSTQKMALLSQQQTQVSLQICPCIQKIKKSALHVDMHTSVGKGLFKIYVRF